MEKISRVRIIERSAKGEDREKEEGRRWREYSLNLTKIYMFIAHICSLLVFNAMRIA